jgi:hypothetical protein
MRSTRFRLHVGMEGKTGKGMGRGERGGGKEVAVCVLGGVGSDAFLLVPFPGNSLDPGARHASRSTTLNLAFKTYDSRILYLPDYRLIPLPCVVLIIPPTTKDAGSHSPTISSARTFGFRQGRKLRHHILKAGRLIIEYSLNDGVAARRGQFEASSRSIGSI